MEKVIFFSVENVDGGPVLTTAALPHEAPPLFTLRFFSVLVIPAFWLVSVSEEEWEKGTPGT